jgi:hypothetical protein
MLTSEIKSKKGSLKTFTAEISTNIDLAKNFFLPPGLQRPDLASKNDSFSFTSKSKDIFNPVENASCVKKETPKFGRTDNHTSTPSKNMMNKLARIRNQIRLENSFKQVFQQEPLNFGEKAFAKPSRVSKGRDFQEKLGRRGLSAKKGNLNTSGHSKMNQSNSSFLSKKKRVGSQQLNRNKKGPKILGQKHLEIFHSKFLNKQTPSKQTFQGVVSGTGMCHKDPFREFQKRNYPCNFETDPFSTLKLLTSKRVSKERMWTKMTPQLTNPNVVGPNPEIRAKNLSKMFKDQFRMGILNSFRNVGKKGNLKSPSKENRKSKVLESTRNGSAVKQKDQSVKRFKKRKLNLRYQSARKYQMPYKSTLELGLTHKKTQDEPRHNEFLMHELRHMMGKYCPNQSRGAKPTVGELRL